MKTTKIKAFLSEFCQQKCPRRRINHYYASHCNRANRYACSYYGIHVPITRTLHPNVLIRYQQQYNYKKRLFYLTSYNVTITILTRSTCTYGKLKEKNKYTILHRLQDSKMYTTTVLITNFYKILFYHFFFYCTRLVHAQLRRI